jgi:hypothetical protein
MPRDSAPKAEVRHRRQGRQGLYCPSRVASRPVAARFLTDPSQVQIAQPSQPPRRRAHGHEPGGAGRAAPEAEAGEACEAGKGGGDGGGDSGSSE